MPKKKDEMNEVKPADYETTPKKQKIKKVKKKKEKQPTEEIFPEMDESFESANTSTGGKTTPNKTSNKKKKNSQQPTQEDTSSEEERWLDAIEKGKLEDVDDELKKIKPKDPKLMTARQRAMYEKNITESNPTSPTGKSRQSLPSMIIDGVQTNVSSSGQLLLALPNFKMKKEKEKLPLTEEDIEKSKMKAQKRKQIADEKREKDKKKTMERLLKKQDSKTVKSTKTRPVKQLVPVISYKNTQDGIFLSFPPNYPFPISPQKATIEPPKKKLCGMAGCQNVKRYNCSKTNIPLCSLECYKKNVETVKQMIF